MDKFILNKAFFLLQHDYILHIDGPGSSGEIWKDGQFFRYRSFGESAVKSTKSELKWIFETIFKNSRFVVFSNWKDIKLSYDCNNPRSMWIFTDGKYNQGV